MAAIISKNFSISNLVREQQKFLFDPRYNPQFTYETEPDESIFARHAYPLSEELLAKAVGIMDRTIKMFGTEEKILAQEGALLSRPDVDKTIQAYLESEHLTPLVKVVSSNQYMSRTSVVTTENKTFELRLRLPLDYREHALPAVLAHEVGTHILRWVNEFQQPWYKKHREYGMREFAPTEEGLAVLHASLFHPSPYFWQPAVTYFAAYHAQTKSFAEVSTLLKPFVPSLERRWKICLRVKRGLHDTSEPGGYKKDLVYLSGLQDVARWLRENDYNAQELYIGKVHHEDLEKMKSFSALQSYQYPAFLNDPNYAKKIEKVLKKNEL
jgi:hypothetical protein